VLLACTVAALLIALWTATRQVYFVGTDPARADAVTIYRGLPYDGPLGIRLYSPVLSSGMTLAQVPAARRRSFTGHKLRSRDDAQSLVRSLERGQLQ
jgi:protein phosphatase